MPIYWRIDPASPVIVPGQLHGPLDARRASAAHVIEHDGRCLMAYWGTDAQGMHHILAAEATLERPNDWRPLGPLIGPQTLAPYNTQGPSFPFLLPVDRKLWLLYYCAWGQPTRRLPNTTGVAISEDAGRTWRYWRDSPMLALDRPYDMEGTGSLWVTHEAGRFRMWYTGIGRFFARPEGVQSGHGEVIPEIGIAYAESSDGLHWEKPRMNWLVAPRHWGVGPYEYIVSKPVMLIDDAAEGAARGGVGSPYRPRYTLWVNTFGVAYRVHRLTSDDGLSWRWTPRAGPQGELGTGGPGTFDDHQRSYPTMLRHGREIRCWYTGNAFGNRGMGYAVADADDLLTDL